MFKIKKIIIIALLIIPWVSYANETINISWKDYSFNQAYNIINNSFNKKWWNDFDKKESAYIELKRKLNQRINKSEKINKLINLFEYSLEKTRKERKEFYSKIQKIKIWESTNNQDIYAYYKWDPKNGYFWIFSNIHGWYEYWTYNTARYLLKELYNSEKTWWFIIPTINPDWLDYYLESDKKYAAYLEWRVNKNNVDLNRNFCTDNYELKSFEKNWYTIFTWINWCNDQNETKIISKLIKDYNFKKIISLHSKWNILFLPDNSFDDKNVIKFWNEIAKKLPWYNFDTNYLNSEQKQNKIKLYEIDEWWIWEYTWTMETYIYEKYKIPVILIELKDHWKIEYSIKNIIELFD